jgi:hypothetical protein
MSIRLSPGFGCVVVLAILLVPGAITAYVTNSPKWLILVPLGTVLLVIIFAAFGRKRKVTPEQYALELERHLLGTEGEWDWDDTTSVAIADPRLEALRLRLSKFDSLSDDRRAEFADIIASLKRGDVPKVKWGD